MSNGVERMVVCWGGLLPVAQSSFVNSPAPSIRLPFVRRRGLPSGGRKSRVSDGWVSVVAASASKFEFVVVVADVAMVAATVAAVVTAAVAATVVVAAMVVVFITEQVHASMSCTLYFRLSQALKRISILHRSSDRVIDDR